MQPLSLSEHIVKMISAPRTHLGVRRMLRAPQHSPCSGGRIPPHAVRSGPFSAPNCALQPRRVLTECPVHAMSRHNRAWDKDRTAAVGGPAAQGGHSWRDIACATFALSPLIDAEPSAHPQAQLSALCVRCAPLCQRMADSVEARAGLLQIGGAHVRRRSSLAFEFSSSCALPAGGE